MDAAAFITQLRGDGITLTVTDSTLAVTPASRLTPEHRDFIKQHKAEILALLDAGQPGNDIGPTNTTPIPARLTRAAERVCRVIHHDDDAAVAEMLSDLAYYPPENWPKLIEHFESQLPPDFDNRRTCRDCRNLASIGICLAAPSMPNATSRWTPDPDRLRRCLWFMPTANDQDQRLGHERWPGLELVPGISMQATP